MDAADARPRSGQADLAEGRVRYRPTLFGSSLLGGLAFGAYASLSSGVAVGVIIALLSCFIADLALSRRILAPTKVGLVVLTPRTASLDGLLVRAVPIAGAFEGLEISAGNLKAGSGWQGAARTIDGGTNQLRIRIAAAGNMRCLQFACRHSTLGLVVAAKPFVQITPARVSCIGPAHRDEIEVRPSQRPLELERLRDYVPGDRPNHVHWMATAKTGQLQVRDDLWQQDEMVIVIDLGPSDREVNAEKIPFVTGLARMAIEEGWRAGLLVRVISFHDTEAHLLDLAHQAARQVDPSMPHHELGNRPAAILVDDIVSDESTMVERLAGIGVGAVPQPSGAHYLLSEEGLWFVE